MNPINKSIENPSIQRPSRGKKMLSTMHRFHRENAMKVNTTNVQHTKTEKDEKKKAISPK